MSKVAIIKVVSLFLVAVMYITLNVILWVKPLVVSAELSKYSTAPVIRIDTENNAEILSKEDYVNAKISIENSDTQEFNFANESARVRGRGNSTWAKPKKPYRIKFDKKTSLFGLPAAKDWALLADYHDITHSRNFVALSTARQMTNTFQSNSIMVELYLNGVYNGLYTLCDQIEVGSTRVDIEKDSADLDTGYFIEMDARAYQEGMLNHDYFILNDRYYTIKSPKTDEDYYSVEQLNYIKNYMSQAFDSLMQENYGDYIDIDSFVDFFLVSEIFDSLDIGHIGIFFYKDAGGKLTMGPLWDFDNSGNAITSSFKPNPEKIDRLWTFEQNQWASALLQNQDYRQRIKARWNEQYDNNIANILDLILEQKETLRPLARRNQLRWNIYTQTYDYKKDKLVYGTYDATFDSFYHYTKNHIIYLNDFFNSLT